MALSPGVATARGSLAGTDFPPPTPDPSLVTDRKIYPPATPGGRPGARTRSAGFPRSRRPPGPARKAPTPTDTAADTAPATAAPPAPPPRSRFPPGRHPRPRQKTDLATDTLTVTAGAISRARPHEPACRLPPPTARTSVTPPDNLGDQKACLQPASASSSASVGSSGGWIRTLILPRSAQTGQWSPPPFTTTALDWLRPSITLIPGKRFNRLVLLRGFG